MLPPSKNSSQLLTFLCEEKSSFTTKLAQISLHTNPQTPSYYKILLFIEYLQLVSSILFLNLPFTNRTKQPLFSNILIYTAKFTNPASWIISGSITPFALIILSFTVLFVIIKAALFFYIALKISKGRQPTLFFIKIWQCIFNLQGRVIYNLLTSFWTVTLYIMKINHEERAKHSFAGVITMTILMISSELALSLYLNIKICFILPRKNLLSAKDNIIEIITLIQKVLLQIFIMISNQQSSSLTYLWIFAVINLIIDLIRNGYFFKTLPLYKFKALFYQRTLLMMVLSLNLAIFVMCIVKSASEKLNDPALLILLWLINFVCLFKISGFFLQKSFWNLISSNSIQSPYLMIHKISAIKELRRLNQTQFGDYSTKFSWKYLANRSANHSILKNIPHFNDSSPLDINSKETSHLIFQAYLENLLKENPDNEFIRLSFAQFNVKKLKLFGDAILITRSLLHSSSFVIKLNAELLLLDIQNLFKQKYSSAEDSQSQLNLREFVFQNSLLSKAKEMMIAQAEIQIQICKETSKEIPNLAQILSKAQKFNTYRTKTITFIENLHRTISDYNLEPLLLCAQYYQTLNHSLKENSQYLKEYSLKVRKYQTTLDDIRILKENIFNQKLCFALVSGNEHDTGHTVYASNTMLNFLGKNADSVLGINFVINTPPCLRAFYATFYKTTAEKLDKEAYGSIAHGFLYHKNNYLIPTEYYFNIFPFVTEGFYIALISKPLPYQKDFMYILENGDIDSTTQQIGEILNILPDSSSFQKKLHHLKEISDYLPMVNDAFNMTTFPDKYPPTDHLSLETAKEIYSLFTSGTDLFLKPTKSHKEPISYRCTLTNIPFGPVVLKLLSLEKNKIYKEDCQTYQTYQTDPLIKASSPQEIRHNLSSSSSSSSQAEVIFQTLEEKEGGWIDIEAMQTESLRGYSPSIHSTRLLSSPDKPKETDHGGLLECITTTRPDEEAIISPSSQQRLITIPKFSQSTGGQHVDFQMTKQQKSARDSLTTSYLSKISNKKRLFKFYQSSLKVDFCPKYVRALYVISYFAFTVFILSQILLKITFNNHSQAIKTKKDILRNSEVRSYQLITIQSGMRILWDIAQGTMNISALGALQPYIEIYPELLVQRIMTLGDLNDNFLRNTSELDPILRDSIFAKNVKIYDNYFGEIPDPYILLDTFKATDSITGAGLKLLEENLWNSSTPAAETTANFLFRNSLNDLPLQNQVISNLVLKSLHDQYASFHIQVDLFGSLLATGFLLVIIAFIVGMWKQYMKETFNLSAFCKLSHSHLEKVIQSYENFKNAIENQSLQNLKEEKISNSSGEKKKEAQKPQSNKKNNPSPRNPEHLKQPNYTSLRKKFYILATKIFLLIISLILFTIVSAVIVHIFEDCFEEKQDQVYVADHSLNRISLLLSSSQELISTKNTSKIENRFALKELEMLIQELISSKTRAYNVLFISEDDQELAKKLRALILEDSCSITKAEIFNFCEVLESNGKKTGLIYLLNDIESYSKDELQGYQKSYESEAELQELKEKNLDMKMITYIVAELACQEFSTLINNSFEKENQRAQKFSTGILIFAFGITFTVFILVWRLVLGRLRAGVSEFKNVLKVLPADLVLSSFILKKFLVDTSKGVLKGLRIDF